MRGTPPPPPPRTCAEWAGRARRAESPPRRPSRVLGDAPRPIGEPPESARRFEAPPRGHPARFYRRLSRRRNDRARPVRTPRGYRRAPRSRTRARSTPLASGARGTRPTTPTEPARGEARANPRHRHRRAGLSARRGRRARSSPRGARRTDERCRPSLRRTPRARPRREPRARRIRYTRRRATTRRRRVAAFSRRGRTSLGCRRRAPEGRTRAWRRRRAWV
mmetsp:Transcript_5877/g.23805  ORF Transcript_5877/g.23805 Transcript_5877/m.23805 type:complete len:221 (-) Transcript_5877:743-1405(-)